MTASTTSTPTSLPIRRLIDVAEQDAQNAAARLLADGCDERSGVLLAHLSSVDTARDMDRIRAALGDEKLTYFGYSYGTVLGRALRGAVSNAHPRHGPRWRGDPALDAGEDSFNQVVGFENALNAFLADCAADPGCAFYNDGDPGAALDALMASVDEQPIEGDGDLEVGPGVVWLGIAAALYNESQWSTLANALASAQAGDGSELLSLSSFITGRIGPGSYTDEVEQRIAVLCVDFERLSFDEKVALQARIAAAAPRLGNPGIGPAGDPCDFWPVPSEQTPRRIEAPGSPPIVVIGTTGDPATPVPAGRLARGAALAGHPASRSRAKATPRTAAAAPASTMPSTPTSST